MSVIAEYFNKSVYGNIPISIEEKNSAIALYTKLLRLRKVNKKIKKMQKKGKARVV